MFKYNEATREISCDDPSLFFVNPGVYKINYTLTDKMAKSMDYSFNIIVACEHQFKLPVTKAPFRPWIKVDNPPEPYIVKIDQLGKVRIGFTR